MSATKTNVADLVESLYRSDSRRVFATLVRVLGDFDLAEEALHDAFAAAVEQWAVEGIPANPRAWLVSVGRFRAIDGLRRRARLDASLENVAARIEATAAANEEQRQQDIEDDRLRLIFTCCHPALPHPAQVALTLREVCGLTTEEIAGAFETRRMQLIERRNQRANALAQAADRILKGIKSRVDGFTAVNDIHGYFASDLMIEKVRDIVSQLGALGDSVKRARARAYEALEGIRFEGMQYRKDIAYRALKKTP